MDPNERLCLNETLVAVVVQLLMNKIYLVGAWLSEYMTGENGLKDYSTNVKCFF